MTDNTGTIQENKKHLFQKGQSGNPAGRPKGSISIRTEIKKRLKANPEKMEELITYYMEEEGPIMRKLLWEMLDGKPKQAVDMEINFPETLIELIRGNG